MTDFLTTVRARMEKRAQYNRTVREIRSMPQDVADDLGITRSDAHRIAWDAIYG